MDRVSLVAPRALRPPARIAVIAPASGSGRERIDVAIGQLESIGFSCVLAENVFSEHRGYLSGDDELRVSELNRLLNDSSFGAFFVSRGGYGTMRILDRVDYEAIRRDPRPIIGFSDITALHQAVARVSQVSTFHGPMLNLDWHDGLSPDRLGWFSGMLSGSAPMIHRFEPSQVFADGRAEGIVFGGCLSLTASLIGTPYDFWIDDGIWFFEDVDEPIYRLDRMLTHLSLSGRFQSLRAVMIGTMKGIDDDEDRARFETLVTEFFGNLKIPVVTGLPFGHEGNNLLIPIGARAIVDTTALTWEFPDPVVA